MHFGASAAAIECRGQITIVRIAVRSKQPGFGLMGMILGCLQACMVCRHLTRSSVILTVMSSAPQVQDPCWQAEGRRY
jgi:surfactin synthase thioesterase subunit